MSPEPGKTESPLTQPRPGHADLVGMQKYGFSDSRDVLERASARETAARVAAGALAKQLLSHLGVGILSHVIQMGKAKVPAGGPESAKAADAEPEAAPATVMKYFIETYGCQMNVHDSERMSGLLESSGYDRTDSEADADLADPHLAGGAAHGLETGGAVGHRMPDGRHLAGAGAGAGDDLDSTGMRMVSTAFRALRVAR